MAQTHDRPETPEGADRQGPAGGRLSVAGVWQQHHRWLVVVLLAHRPRGAELDDLLQEVALILSSRLTDLRDPARLRPWLRTVAVNVAREAGRQKARRAERKVVPLESEPPVEDRSLDRLELSDEARQVVDAALSLAPEYREPLLLRSLHGLSQRDIAATLELEVTTVETRIARARRMLRERFRRADESGPASMRQALAEERQAP